ncbi:MAG: hypothetical protein A4E60_00048 [Syntrophorhabdus sp. PtaB.Bin047]|jgi:hypothetical protein|nr:MAG: hypothetical protein A4E60_00048 [Syntrophorhabdus sp. PtaB.Bin047]
MRYFAVALRRPQGKHSSTAGFTGKQGTFILGLLLSFCLFGLAAMEQKACAEAVYIIPPAPESSAVLKYKSVHYSGTILDKPSCDPGMTAKIFVTPVRMLGGSSTTIVPIAGVSTFATDNGNGKWTVRGQVKTADNGLLEDSSAIVLVVEVYCCFNEFCS